MVQFLELRIPTSIVKKTFSPKTKEKPVNGNKVKFLPGLDF